MSAEKGKRIFEILRSRSFRLIVLVAFFAAFFAHARFLLFVAIGVAIFASALRHFSWGKKVLDVLIFIALLALVVQLLAYKQSADVRKFFADNSPVRLEEVPDGTYAGEALGANGNISVRVEIKNHRFENLEILSHREPVFIFDEAIKNLPSLKSTELSDYYPLAFRGWISVDGLRSAIEKAILSKHPEFPKLPKWASFIFKLTAHRPDKIALNAFFVLFIVFLGFDYALGPVLFPSTGQSLSCYNCQACVGVCPIKDVNGLPFPITLVTEARLGRFDVVKELAKFCVACGKCAGKCPVGNSAPSIAAAAVIAAKRKKAVNE